MRKGGGLCQPSSFPPVFVNHQGYVDHAWEVYLLWFNFNLCSNFFKAVYFLSNQFIFFKLVCLLRPVITDTYKNWQQLLAWPRGNEIELQI